MSWIDRLQPTIELESPDGDSFSAKWKGNDRTREKKLGLFTYPDFAGTITQDLNVNSTKYPLTIYFSDSDHDIEAEKFFKATAQTGLWTVIHPTKGELTLQLVSAIEQIQTIDSGNMTVFNIEFIEPASETTIQSTTELQSGISSAIDNTNGSALQQFADQVSEAVGNARTAVNNATNKVNAAIDSVLSPLAQIDNDINSAFNSISRGIDNTISNAVLFPSQLAGQIQNIVQLPAKLAISTKEKLSQYADLVSDLVGLDGTTKETFAVKELVLSSCLCAVADIASGTDAQTRTEIVEQINSLSTIFDTVITSLDSDQSKVITDKIENQYISMETSYPQNLLTVSLAINYLLKESIDLSIEKIITLKEYKLPYLITIEEYGTHELLDFFYETNKIDKNEFLLLPPGKQIFIYPGVVA